MTHSPTTDPLDRQSRANRTALRPAVGEIAQDAAAAGLAGAYLSRTLSDFEHELHCEDTEHLFLMAWERWELYRCPHDRDEAVLHLHRMNVAIQSRPAAVQAARHAEFERRLDEGCDFFGAAGRAAARAA